MTDPNMTCHDCRHWRSSKEWRGALQNAAPFCANPASSLTGNVVYPWMHACSKFEASLAQAVRAALATPPEPEA